MSLYQKLEQSVTFDMQTSTQIAGLLTGKTTFNNIKKLKLMTAALKPI